MSEPISRFARAQELEAPKHDVSQHALLQVMESIRALLVSVELLNVVVFEGHVSAFVDNKQNQGTSRLMNRRNAQG